MSSPGRPGPSNLDSSPVPRRLLPGLDAPGRTPAVGSHPTRRVSRIVPKETERVLEGPKEETEERKGPSRLGHVDHVVCTRVSRLRAFEGDGFRSVGTL